VFHRGAHDVAPDAPEPVDPDLHCHRLSPSLWRTCESVQHPIV